VFENLGLLSIKSLVILLVCALFAQASADDGVDYYENAFLNLYLEYQLAYEALNQQIEKCSLRTESGDDFGPVVKKIPTGLSEQQLNSAVLLLKKQHSDKCNSSAVGMYVSKASDLKHVIKTAQDEKINLKSGAIFELILTKIDATEKLLFSTPRSYFKMLSQYQSISKTARDKLESIEKLQSNYNMLDLMDALQESYAYSSQD